PLQGAPALKPFLRKGPALKVSDEGDRIEIASSRVKFVFDRTAGTVVSYRVNGVEYFDRGFGLKPHFRRGPTDNDYCCGLPRRLQVWKEASRDFRVTEASTKVEGDAVKLSVAYALPSGNGYYTDYTVWPSGAVEADIRFTPTQSRAAEAGASDAELTATYTPGSEGRTDRSKLDVPRIGLRFRLPAAMERVEYYGRGPEENYQDRNTGSLVGRYATTASEMYFPYVRPQENGHRTDVRWVRFDTPRGRGLEVRADSTMEFNALRNSVEDFDGEECVSRPYQWRNLTPEQKKHDEAAARNSTPRRTHINDIAPRDFVEVCLDLRQRGVGGYDSWGSQPEPWHMLPADREYRWGFTMIPR
ncbi:MAG: beta-galactosidase, partial [Alistipes sp.]|nr:beta-galactosidase [Alistipes sp.]